MLTWRTLRDGALPPARNMAVDEAVLRLHPAGPWDATLRFYAWSSPTLSLGYAQEFSAAVDEAACRARGVAVVRRPTGGWTVLHADELTYSIVSSSAGASFSGCGPLETYRRIALAFVKGLGAVGIEAALISRAELARASEKAPSAGSPAPCFEIPSRHEVAAPDGRKLLGNAQRRIKESFLQHGSVPISIDRESLYAATGQEPSNGERFAALGELTSAKLTPALLADVFTKAFAETFGAVCAPGTLTGEEEALAQKLEREKYATEEWNRMRREPERLRRAAGA
ncbi:MAG: lipoate--protein ligase family protein [Acidobacteriota bacterium]|nr:MAG: lipoate--protein ligase family protein [Acidobacteriota bacterium]